MHSTLAPRTPAIARQLVAARPRQLEPHQQIAEDCSREAKAYAERVKGDSVVRLAYEVGLLRTAVHEALAKAGDADIPRDPCLDGYNLVRVDGASLELGWRYRYRCVEVVECWHGGEEIARFLGESRLAGLADYLTFEVLA
jgi:hypothetical protein